MNASSIEFLNQHDMDFNMWTQEGVPYVTLEMATSARIQVRVAETKGIARKYQQE